MFSRVLLVLLLTILQASPSQIQRVSWAAMTIVAMNCIKEAPRSADANAKRILMSMGEQSAVQLVILGSSSWKVRYFPKATTTASVCRQDKMYAAVMRRYVGRSRMSRGRKTRMQMTIWSMIETTELKKTMRMDLLASPNLIEKYVLVHELMTSGAVVATPLKPYRQSRMVSTAARSNVVKLKTIWTMRRVRRGLESGGDITSIGMYYQRQRWMNDH